MIDKKNIGKAPCGQFLPDTPFCRNQQCCMQDTTPKDKQCKHCYPKPCKCDNIRRAAEEFGENWQPNGPSASGIYEKQMHTMRVPINTTGTGNVLTSEDVRAAYKILCAGCDADADCHKCEGNKQEKCDYCTGPDWVDRNITFGYDRSDCPKCHGNSPSH